MIGRYLEFQFYFNIFVTNNISTKGTLMEFSDAVVIDEVEVS